MFDKKSYALPALAKIEKDLALSIASRVGTIIAATTRIKKAPSY